MILEILDVYFLVCGVDIYPSAVYSLYIKCNHSQKKRKKETLKESVLTLGIKQIYLH